MIEEYLNKTPILFMNFLFQFYKFCLAKEKLLEECQKQFPSIQMFPVQFGKKHAQADSNRPGRKIDKSSKLISFSL